MTTDPVMEALGEQVECYRRLARLAELQHEHVRQSETEQLLELLQRRQRVLTRIGSLEETVAPAKKRWGEYLSGLDAEDRSRAEEMLGETRTLLQRIVEADKDDALILQQRKLNLGRQINQASAAKQVNRSYAAAAYGAPAARMDVQR